MNSNDISQLIERALAWLEEEYARYLQLKKSYNNLKDKVDSVAVQEFDSGKIRRIIRKIGKAEWRFDRYQKNLKPVMVVFSNQLAVGEIDAGYGSIRTVFKKIGEELKVIDIEAKNLLIDSSSHTGKLSDLYEHFKVSLKARSMEQAHQAILDIGIVIDDAITWIGSITLELEDIKDKQLPRLEEELRRRKQAEEEAVEKRKGELRRKKELERLKAKARKEIPVLNNIEKAFRNLRRADALLQEPLLETVMGYKGNILRLRSFPNIGRSLQLKQESDFKKFKDYLSEARNSLYKFKFKENGRSRENEILNFAENYDQFRAFYYSEQKKQMYLTIRDSNEMIQGAINLLLEFHHHYTSMFYSVNSGLLLKEIYQLKLHFWLGYPVENDFISNIDQATGALVVILHLVFSVLIHSYALYAETKNLRYDPSFDTSSV